MNEYLTRISKWFEFGGDELLKTNWARIASEEDGLHATLRAALRIAESAESVVGDLALIAVSALNWRELAAIALGRENDTIGVYEEIIDRAVLHPLGSLIDLLLGAGLETSRQAIAYLLGETEVVHQIDLPIVVVNRVGGVQSGAVGVGLVIKLRKVRVTERLSAPALTHDIMNRFTVLTDGVFEESAKRAFSSAIGSLEESVASWCQTPDWIVTWAIHDMSGQKIAAPSFQLVNGPSASGELAVGLHHILGETVPDPGVLILAECVDEDGTFGPVSEVGEKVQTALSAKLRVKRGCRFFWVDTICVARSAAAGETVTNYDAALNGRATFVQKHQDNEMTACALAERVRIVPLGSDQSDVTPDVPKQSILGSLE